jgi:Flp pilus assembly protein TadG
MCRFVSPARKRRMARRRRDPTGTRHGVAAIESVILLSTLLMVLFVVFDFGLAAFQYNTLAATARRVARAASLHGAAAPPEQSAWGPAAYAGTAADNTEIAATAAPLLATMASSDVTLNVTWPDGDTQENNRVRVRVAYTHHAWIPFLSFSDSLNLHAESTMPIVH